MAHIVARSRNYLNFIKCAHVYAKRKKNWSQHKNIKINSKSINIVLLWVCVNCFSVNRILRNKNSKNRTTNIIFRFLNKFWKIFVHSKLLTAIPSKTCILKRKRISMKNAANLNFYNIIFVHQIELMIVITLYVPVSSIFNYICQIYLNFSFIYCSF